ncbi:MAG: COX15/CtaA family protein [Xanthomonadales bacterium]|nr:COX15/CtaA family protein [Xanthomonadales bacterium]ODU93183.1 MAG: cytochrome oxidase assembly protein [Rhodanobacter sp. SCN 66-43]OJY82086.1 MAG: heme A synthase [Xanthomonadales bacterium 66-474]
MQAMPLPLRALAWVACVFAFCVIVFGAFVRLSNAGLSCPDWPTCYGRITWPVKPAAVAKADQAFPNRPVETHKAWREQSHRFLAGTLGMLVLAMACAATYFHKQRFGLVAVAVVLIGIGIPLYMARDYVTSSVVAAIGEALLLAIAIFWRDGGWRRIAVLALAVVCFQALLGMWTVTWLLKPIVVSGHLLGGMATFALLAWIAWRLSMPPVLPHARRRGWFVAVAVGLALLCCQIFLGGWTSSNYAALACGIGGSAFPTCLGQWWPAMDFHQGFILWRGIGVDFQGGILDAASRTAIQMAHRFGALAVFVYLAWLAHGAWRAGLRGYGMALAVLLVGQVLLGIGNVTLGAPLWIAVAHTGGAALLLFALVSLLLRSSVIAASPDQSTREAVRPQPTPERTSMS